MMQPVKLTRVMADPYEGQMPHAYIVYKQSQLCRCGHLHQWSTMMTETVTRSPMGALTIFHRRVDDLRYNLPVKRVIEAQTERLMFCHECYATATLAHLPLPPQPDPKPAPSCVGSKTPQTLHDKPAKAAKPKAPATTIDDLLI
jgi:hypothetical protein